MKECYKRNLAKSKENHELSTTRKIQQNGHEKYFLVWKKQPSLSTTWASKKTHTDDLVQYFFVSLLILYKLKKVKESSHLSLENESKNHTEQKFGRV